MLLSISFISIVMLSPRQTHYIVFKTIWQVKTQNNAEEQ
nr:MAG TPA: hypothetical protein [Caudoviricetes sp.]